MLDLEGKPGFVFLLVSFPLTPAWISCIVFLINLNILREPSLSI